MTCTTGHPELKSSVTLLREHTTLVAPVTEDDAIAYYLRNCKLCGSSLCIEPEVNERIETP